MSSTVATFPNSSLNIRVRVTSTRELAFWTHVKAVIRFFHILSSMIMLFIVHLQYDGLLIIWKWKIVIILQIMLLLCQTRSGPSFLVLETHESGFHSRNPDSLLRTPFDFYICAGALLLIVLKSYWTLNICRFFLIVLSSVFNEVPVNSFFAILLPDKRINSQISGPHFDTPSLTEAKIKISNYSQ